MDGTPCNRRSGDHIDEEAETVPVGNKLRWLRPSKNWFGYDASKAAQGMIAQKLSNVTVLHATNSLKSQGERNLLTPVAILVHNAKRCACLRGPIHLRKISGTQISTRLNSVAESGPRCPKLPAILCIGDVRTPAAARRVIASVRPAAETCKTLDMHHVSVAKHGQAGLATCGSLPQGIRACGGRIRSKAANKAFNMNLPE